MTNGRRMRKARRKKRMLLEQAVINTPEEIVEPIVEEVVVELTMEDIEEVANEFGYKVNQTANYIAIKKGRLNVATISNDMRKLTKKNGEVVEIADKEAVRGALENDK